MLAQHQRPVFLNLLQIRLPLPSIASIMHRISGVAMVLAIPFLALLLHYSLAGAETFAYLLNLLQTSLVVKAGLFLAFWTLLYHLFAGVRFLLIDIEIGVEKSAARLSSAIVIALAPAAALLLTGAVL